MARHPGSGELRAGRQQPSPEEELAGSGEREVETLEQPEREQGIDDQPASEGIDREQRRQFDHDAARRPQRFGRRCLLVHTVVRQGAIQDEDQDAGQPVGDEHQTQRVELGQAGIGQHLRDHGRQRTGRGTQGADEGIAREQEGARLALRRFGQPRMLQRQEDADVAGAGVHRTDEGDDQQRPEGADAAQAGQQQTSGGHQPGGGEE